MLDPIWSKSFLEASNVTTTNCWEDCSRRSTTHYFIPQELNRLCFQPEFSFECIIWRNSFNPCEDDHTNVIHVPLNNSGDYVSFPSAMFHWGYYNELCWKVFITVQLFMVPKSTDYDFHVSHTIMNESWVIKLETIQHRAYWLIYEMIYSSIGMKNLQYQIFFHPKNTS